MTSPSMLRQTPAHDLNVEGLTAGGAKGVFKAVDASGNTYELADDGSIQVNRNEELTLTFTPDDLTTDTIQT